MGTDLYSSFFRLTPTEDRHSVALTLPGMPKYVMGDKLYYGEPGDTYKVKNGKVVKVELSYCHNTIDDKEEVLGEVSEAFYTRSLIPGLYRKRKCERSVKEYTRAIKVFYVYTLRNGDDLLVTNEDCLYKTEQEFIDSL